MKSGAAMIKKYILVVPKGVIITCGNLDHNLEIITESLQSNRDTVNVSWLPQYHDVSYWHLIAL